MRVLLVADVIGGVRAFTEELVRSLVQAEVEVDLALIGPDARALADVGASSCQRRDLRLEWMAEPWADVRATAEWVEELRAGHRPDVVHMNTFTPVLDSDVPVLLSAHSCVLTWWRAVHGRDAPAEWAAYRRLVQSALRRAQQVAVPTRALLRELTAVYGELPRAAVVANGRRGSDPSVVRSCAQRLVVAAGRLWDEAKNADVVVRAAPAIGGQVVLIGAGGAPSPARAGDDDPTVIDGHGLVATGELDGPQVAEWMSRAAVFVEPARYEPFGLAALEAALGGCALVLGDIPSLREVWGDAATYVSPDDPQALAHAVNALLDDPDRRARAARRAGQQARRYSAEAMGQRYIGLYAQLARLPMVAT